jgi:glycosyltransferase involved in cell wall biosynthesis
MNGKATIPRILYVTSHWSHRETCASEIRSINIARALNEFGEVKLLVVDAEGRGSEWYKDPKGEFEVVRTLQLNLYPNRTLGRKLKWTIDPFMQYPHGCGVGKRDSASAVRLAKDYDLVWFSKLRTANMFSCWKWERSLADIDDIPSMFEWSQIRGRASFKNGAYAFLRYLSWRRRDSLLADRFNSLAVCSEADKGYLKRLRVKAPVHVIPNGFSAPNPGLSRSRAIPPRVGFIGIFDYAPNVEGIHWFTKECWPRIMSAVPGACLRLVGRFSDGPLKPSGPGIDGLGWIDDAVAEISTWSVMIVPILMGAGTRGKIAQALSLRCPIVSTPLGAYGYDVTDGREMRLADSAGAFASACIEAIENPERAAEMAARGWRRYIETWTWDAIRPNIWAAATENLSRNGYPARTNFSSSETADRHEAGQNGIGSCGHGGYPDALRLGAKGETP